MSAIADVRRRDAAATARDLLEAARHRFAREGFRATRVRDIAADAGVDQALVIRYFGSKSALFQAACSSSREIEEVLRGRPDELADRLIHWLLAPGADGADGQFLILLRAADHEPAARALRLRVDALTRVVANMIVFPDRELRAELVASMVLGVVVQRSLLRRLPLKGVRADQLAPCFMAITELLYRR